MIRHLLAGHLPVVLQIDGNRCGTLLGSQRIVLHVLMGGYHILQPLHPLIYLRNLCAGAEGGADADHSFVDGGHQLRIHKARQNKGQHQKQNCRQHTDFLMTQKPALNPVISVS